MSRFAQPSSASVSPLSIPPSHEREHIREVSTPKSQSHALPQSSTTPRPTPSLTESSIEVERKTSEPIIGHFTQRIDKDHPNQVPRRCEVSVHSVTLLVPISSSRKYFRLSVSLLGKRKKNLRSPPILLDGNTAHACFKTDFTFHLDYMHHYKQRQYLRVALYKRRKNMRRVKNVAHLIMSMEHLMQCSFDGDVELISVSSKQTPIARIHTTIRNRRLLPNDMVIDSSDDSSSSGEDDAEKIPLRKRMKAKVVKYFFGRRKDPSHGRKLSLRDADEGTEEDVARGHLPLDEKMAGKEKKGKKEKEKEKGKDKGKGKRKGKGKGGEKKAAKVKTKAGLAVKKKKKKEMQNEKKREMEKEEDKEEDEEEKKKIMMMMEEVVGKRERNLFDDGGDDDLDDEEDNDDDEDEEDDDDDDDEDDNDEDDDDDDDDDDEDEDDEDDDEDDDYFEEDIDFDRIRVKEAEGISTIPFVAMGRSVSGEEMDDDVDEEMIGAALAHEMEILAEEELDEDDDDADVDVDELEEEIDDELGKGGDNDDGGDDSDREMNDGEPHDIANANTGNFHDKEGEKIISETMPQETVPFAPKAETMTAEHHRRISSGAKSPISPASKSSEVVVVKGFSRTDAKPAHPEICVDEKHEAGIPPPWALSNVISSLRTYSERLQERDVRLISTSPASPLFFVFFVCQTDRMGEPISKWITSEWWSSVFGGRTFLTATSLDVTNAVQHLVMDVPRFRNVDESSPSLDSGKKVVVIGNDQYFCDVAHCFLELRKDLPSLQLLYAPTRPKEESPVAELLSKESSGFAKMFFGDEMFSSLPTASILDGRPHSMKHLKKASSIGGSVMSRNPVPLSPSSPSSTSAMMTHSLNVPTTPRATTSGATAGSVGKIPPSSPSSSKTGVALEPIGLLWAGAIEHMCKGVPGDGDNRGWYSFVAALDSQLQRVSRPVSLPIGEAVLTLEGGSQISVPLLHDLHIFPTEIEVDREWNAKTTLERLSKKRDASVELKLDFWLPKRGSIMKSSIRASIAFLEVSRFALSEHWKGVEKEGIMENSLLFNVLCAKSVTYKRGRHAGEIARTDRKDLPFHSVSDEIVKLMCAPTSETKPFRLYVDGREWKGVKYVTVSPQWMSHTMKVLSLMVPE